MPGRRRLQRLRTTCHPRHHVSSTCLDGCCRRRCSLTCQPGDPWVARLQERQLRSPLPPERTFPLSSQAAIPLCAHPGLLRATLRFPGTGHCIAVRGNRARELSPANSGHQPSDALLRDQGHPGAIAAIGALNFGADARMGSVLLFCTGWRFCKVQTCP